MPAKEWRQNLLIPNVPEPTEPWATAEHAVMGSSQLHTTWLMAGHRCRGRREGAGDNKKVLNMGLRLDQLHTLRYKRGSAPKIEPKAQIWAVPIWHWGDQINYFSLMQLISHSNTNSTLNPEFRFPFWNDWNATLYAWNRQHFMLNLCQPYIGLCLQCGNRDTLR